MDSHPVQLLASGILLGWAALESGGGQPGDGELMRRIASGDSQAFEQIYDRHARPVYSLLLRMTRDQGRAEDVMQEVFLTLWRQAGRYDPAALSALPWLLVIARHRALDGLRSAQARHEQTASDDGLDWAATAAAGGGKRASFEAQFWERQALEQIRGAMAGLSPEERRVIEMAYFDGCTQAEISQQTTTPLGTVKTWTRSGLAKLRAALQ